MAKSKETKTPETVPTPAQKSQGENDVFTRVLDPDGRPLAIPAGTRIAPQAQVIVNVIEAALPDGITRAQLVKNLEGVIVTRQPIGRIVAYYQKYLTTEIGLVTLTRSAAPVAQ